jgi:hypothetical protein
MLLHGLTRYWSCRMTCYFSDPLYLSWRIVSDSYLSCHVTCDLSDFFLDLSYDMWIVWLVTCPVVWHVTFLNRYLSCRRTCYLSDPLSPPQPCVFLPSALPYVLFRGPNTYCTCITCRLKISSTLPAVSLVLPMCLCYKPRRLFCYQP